MPQPIAQSGLYSSTSKSQHKPSLDMYSQTILILGVRELRDTIVCHAENTMRFADGDRMQQYHPCPCYHACTHGLVIYA